RARPGLVQDRGVLLPRLRHPGRSGVPAAGSSAGARHPGRHRLAQGAARAGRRGRVMEINVDIGGTFTDCFATADGTVASAKALTTHHDLAQGFMTAVDDLARSFGTSSEGLLG